MRIIFILLIPFVKVHACSVKMVVEFSDVIDVLSDNTVGVFSSSVFICELFS